MSMTIQEAIRCLHLPGDHLKNYDEYGIYIDDELKEAMQMASAALREKAERICDGKYAALLPPAKTAPKLVLCGWCRMMDELKKQLAEMCQQQLSYYDVVNECAEAVEYGLIIDFLFERLAEIMTGGKEQ